MKQYVLFYSIICMLVTSWQKQPAITFSPWRIYTGSTPAGTYIKSALKIDAGIPCEFIKWDVWLMQGRGSTEPFKMTIQYGESQPNTNGFKNGGIKMEVSGTYTFEKGKGQHSGRHYVILQSDQLETPIALLKLNDNLFYILDRQQKCLVGNGGFSYLLNLTKE